MPVPEDVRKEWAAELEREAALVKAEWLAYFKAKQKDEPNHGTEGSHHASN